MASARRDIRYWSARRATASVIPEPSDNSAVRIGHTVTIVREDDRRQTFRIVGEDEADPAQGTIMVICVGHLPRLKERKQGSGR